jgi:hypothetical protein
MKYEITTAEAAEVFSVTPKTIALWSQQRIMVKLRHGTYDLKQSLQNWTMYQQCIHEGFADPLAIWQIRRDMAWSEAHPLHCDLENLRDISELGELEPVEIGLPAEDDGKGGNFTSK